MEIDAVEDWIRTRMGWTMEKSNDRDGVCWHCNGIQSEVAAPDYTKDLNAAYEAEERLIWNLGLKTTNAWRETICEQYGILHRLHLTALERCKAIISATTCAAIQSKK